VSDSNWPKILHIVEPKLAFRYGQQLEYSRDGLYLYGPVDARETPRQIRYGFIGTQSGLERFERWASDMSSFIATPLQRRGAKALEPHHVPFPGFSEAFHAIWSSKPAAIISDIDEADLHRRIHISNRHEAIKSAVDVFVDRLIAEQKRSEDPPSFWYVVVPEFVYELGRPQSTVSKAARVGGKVTLTERDALKLATQPTLFGLDEQEAEIYKYEKNFRRQLKARLLNHQIVTQIVRESTLAPNDFVKSNGDPKRRVEDAATIAWKLGAGSYYKSGGRPWQIANMRPGVCYVGLVYKRQEQDGTSRHSVCAAQMFLSDGEGVVFRGALGPWFHPDTKQFHLDQAAAARARGAADEAAQLDRRADAERGRMHGLLGELATLETELAELERVRKTVADAPRPPPRAQGGGTGTAGATPRPPSIDDALDDLKKRAGASPSSASASSSPPRATPSARPPGSSGGPSTVDDELAALKRKMAGAPPKKK